MKQKHENDTLTIICVKDNSVSKLVNAMDEFSSKTSGEASQTDGVIPSGKVLQEYEPSKAALQVVSAFGWYRYLYLSMQDDRHTRNASSSPSPPPKS